MSTKTHLSQTADLSILRYLWDWKLATTSGLHRKFFPGISGEAAYNRLYRMERAGYIQTQVDVTGKHHLWILTRKGFATVKEELPPLKEDGFRSENPAHDLLVSATHLGDLLFRESNGVNLLTEQQLRRYQPEFYPAWVPKKASHIPDGYWHLSQPTPHTIALEIELSQKGRVDYEKVARFYDNHPQISKILWVVRWESLADAIQRSIHKATDGNVTHSFATVKEVVNKGWQASLFLGPERGKVIWQLLTNCGPSLDQPVCTVFALDTRKSPYRTAHSENSILERFSHWMRI